MRTISVAFLVGLAGLAVSCASAQSVYHSPVGGGVEVAANRAANNPIYAPLDTGTYHGNQRNLYSITVVNYNRGLAATVACGVGGMQVPYPRVELRTRGDCATATAASIQLGGMTFPVSGCVENYDPYPPPPALGGTVQSLPDTVVTCVAAATADQLGRLREPGGQWGAGSQWRQ